MNYDYDITDFPNQAVNLSVLQSEINNNASITIHCSGASRNDDTITIFFLAAILPDEELVLDAVVSSHQGAPSPASATPVVIEPTGDLSKQLIISGFQHSAEPLATSVNFDISFAEDRKIQGAMMSATNNVLGDRMNIYLVHPTLGIVGTFGENVYLPITGQMDVISEGTADLPAGIIFRIQYIAATLGVPHFVVNVRTWR